MDENLLRFNNNEIILIDLESYNLNLSWHFNRFWQYSSLKFKGSSVLEEKDIHVDWSKDAPHLKIGEGAKIVTKYNEEYEKSVCIQPKEAFDAFWNDIEKVDYIMGHNILRFDIYLLRGFAEYMGVDWKFIMTKLLDTNALAKGIKLNIPFNPKNETLLEYQYKVSSIIARGVKTNLTALGKEYGIQVDYENLHNSLNDIRLNFEVWKKIKYQLSF